MANKRIEDAAYKYVSNLLQHATISANQQDNAKDDFIKGAEWQLSQRENTVINSLEKQVQDLYDAKYKIIEAAEVNNIFRSFCAICEREGKDTNWPAITAQVKTILELQHKYGKTIEAGLVIE